MNEIRLLFKVTNLHQDQKKPLKPKTVHAWCYMQSIKSQNIKFLQDMHEIHVVIIKINRLLMRQFL